MFSNYTSQNKKYKTQNVSDLMLLLFDIHYDSNYTLEAKRNSRNVWTLVDYESILTFILYIWTLVDYDSENVYFNIKFIYQILISNFNI